MQEDTSTYGDLASRGRLELSDEEEGWRSEGEEVQVVRGYEEVVVVLP